MKAKKLPDYDTGTLLLGEYGDGAGQITTRCSCGQTTTRELFSRIGATVSNNQPFIELRSTDWSMAERRSQRAALRARQVAGAISRVRRKAPDAVDEIARLKAH
jgi:hypothetical protein